MITLSIKDLYEIKIPFHLDRYLEVTMLSAPPSHRSYYNTFKLYEKECIIRFITKHSYCKVPV
jgi:hypothetical protein